MREAWGRKSFETPLGKAKVTWPLERAWAAEHAFG